ncbi:hypothetical protein [Enterococcus sp. AZ109]|uniref:hypothetical protein n=1 Tax=Enterococcus sp. AZ109 TaxID=2774634 RepID=UPI003F1F3DBA
MKKIAVLLLGVIVLLLLAFVGTNYMTSNSAPTNYVSSSSGTSSTSTEDTRFTESSSTLPEDSSFLEGYYWNGYLDQRRKIRISSEEEKYFEPLSTSQISDVSQDPAYSWYQLDGVPTKVQNGSYVKVHFRGPIQQSNPAVIANVTDGEIND